MADVVLKIIADSTDAVTGIIDVEKASKSLRGELERLDKELKNVSQFDPGKKSELQKQYRDVEKSLKDLEKPLEDTKKKQDDLNKSQEEGVKTSKSIGKSFAEFAKQAGIVTLALGAVYKILSAVGTALKDTAKGMGTITRAQTIWNQAIYELSQLGKGESATLKELGEYSDRYIAFKLKQANVIQKNVILQNEYNDLMVQAADQSKTATQQAELLTKAEQKDQEIRQNKITNLKEELSLAKDLANRQKVSLSAALNVKNIENQIIEIEGENRRLVSQRSSKEQAKRKEDFAAYMEMIDRQLQAQDQFQDMSMKLLEDYNDAQIELLEGNDKLKAQRDYGLKQLAEFKKQMQVLGKLSPEQEKMFAVLAAQIWSVFYDSLEEEAAKPLPQDQVDAISRALIKPLEGIQKSIVNNLPKDEFDFTLWDKLGLSEDEVADVKEALGDAFEDISDTLQDYYDKEFENAEKHRELLDTRVEETQQALEDEIRLYEAGYASNVTLKKQELETLKKARDEALKEEEKAAKRQMVIDAALQAASLASATAKLFAKETATKGIVGIVTAGIGVAAMLVSFAASLAKIKSATAAYKLAEGGSGSDTGIITGKSHSQGGEKFLDHVEVERGEQWGVLSRPASEKYGKVFHEMVSSFNKNEMPSFMPVTNQVRVENNGPNSRLDKVNGSIKKLNESILKQSQVSFSGGKKIIRTGNKIRIIG